MALPSDIALRALYMFVTRNSSQDSRSIAVAFLTFLRRVENGTLSEQEALYILDTDENFLNYITLTTDARQEDARDILAQVLLEADNIKIILGQTKDGLGEVCAAALSSLTSLTIMNSFAEKLALSSGSIERDVDDLRELSGEMRTGVEDLQKESKVVLKDVRQTARNTSIWNALAVSAVVAIGSGATGYGINRYGASFMANVEVVVDNVDAFVADYVAIVTAQEPPSWRPEQDVSGQKPAKSKPR